eukprot:4943519-Amphidinium_carterae.1
MVCVGLDLEGEIIEQLAACHGWKPQEVQAASPKYTQTRLSLSERIVDLDMAGTRASLVGADGNCLFLSIAPQVTAEDWEQVPGEWADALGGDLPGRWSHSSYRDANSQNLCESGVLQRRMHLFDPLLSYQVVLSREGDKRHIAMSSTCVWHHLHLGVKVAAHQVVGCSNTARTGTAAPTISNGIRAGPAVSSHHRKGATWLIRSNEDVT